MMVSGLLSTVYFSLGLLGVSFNTPPMYAGYHSNFSSPGFDGVLQPPSLNLPPASLRHRPTSGSSSAEAPVATTATSAKMATRHTPTIRMRFKLARLIFPPP